MVAQVKPVQYQIHDVAKLFPLMSEEEYTALVGDIKKHGLREAIWLFEGKIIDGRNRYRACNEIGIEPQYRYYDDKDSLIEFVVSQNLHRRHLSSSQRAMLAVAIKKEIEKETKKRQIQLAGSRSRQDLTQIFEQGQSPASKPVPSKDRNQKTATAQAAKITGTNRQYVSDAEKITEKAPEVAERVKQGKMDMQDAKAIAALDEKKQKVALDVLDNGGAKNGRKAAAMVLQATTSVKDNDTAPQSKPQPLINLKGRSEEDFQACTRARGATERFDEFAANTLPAAVVRGASDHDKVILKDRIARIIIWLQQLQKELA